jgi:hypothetical protein
MKTINESNSFLGNTTLVFGLVSLIGLSSGHTQEMAMPIQSVPSAQPDSIVQITADAQGLPMVSPEDLPRAGTFWVMMPGYGGNLTALPYPCMPPSTNGLPVYSIAGNSFLVDDTGGQVLAAGSPLAARPNTAMITSALETQANTVLNLIDMVQGTQLQSMGMAIGMDIPSPGDSGGGGGTNGFYSDSFNFTPNYGTNLYIAQFSISGGNVMGIMSNTQPGIEYEIQAETDLTQNNWISEGLFPGSLTTNWTPFSIAAFNPTNNLFLRIRSWVSSDGSGLPDWWELQYFGHTGVDPDSDPTGDGTTVWEDFEQGLNPTNFNLPSGINNVQAALTSSNSVLLTWSPAPGPVTGYTIYRYDYVLNQSQTIPVGVTTQYLDTTYISYPAWDTPISYSVSADYASGNSGWSGASPLVEYGIPTAKVLMGSGGSQEFVLTGVPLDAAGVQITRHDYLTRYTYPAVFSGSNSFFVPVSAFANGAYIVPTNQVGLGSDGSDFYVQTVWSNGISSQPTGAGYLEGQEHRGVWGGISIEGQFNDASTHLEQNAIFLLRAASLTGPFVYSFDHGYGQSPVYEPTNYAYASFWRVNEDDYNGVGNASDLDWSIPFWENYQFRNFVFSTANVDSSGFLNTGADANYELINPTTFAFPATNSVGLSALLGSSQTTWMVPYTDPSQLGITTSSGYFYLPNNIYNYFGLKLLSVMVAHNHRGTLYFDTLNANGYLAQTNDTYYFYPQFDQPNLKTLDYYFGRSQNNSVNYWQSLGSDPLPGDYGFSPNNAQPLILATVGTPLQVGAFAEQAILNGDTTKPVYVSQYFDKAYKVDSNGNVTTNQTGILSPYGDFLPTEPGPTALVTMPASDGQRGTDIVYVASLQLDVNHDGNMQSSLFGPDSAWNTMNFWVNELYDQPGNGTILDQDVMVNQNQGSSFNTNLQPNYVYQQITCQRDLENFARLWIRGLPSLPASQGYSVTVSLDPNIWNDYSAINLYQAVESGGGTAYLTDTNIAAAQIAAPYGNALAQLSPWGYGVTLPTDGQGRLTMTNFLFEGSAIPGYGDGTGSAGIVLTVSQNGQPIAQSEVYVNFSHVRDLYERAMVTNVIQTWPEMVQQPETSGFEVLSTPGYNAFESKQLAVFVHGWKMSAWDWEDFSDLMFKRLYWQGFQGRFATLRWPTRSTDTDTNNLLFGVPSVNFTYNRSEHIAFESGTGAAAYFDDLRSRYTNYIISACSHSMGGIVMMEALKELAASNEAPLDNYVLMQAAVPAHCYDTSVTNFPLFTNVESVVPTPNVYSNDAAGIDSSLRGKAINFYNPDDFALLVWQGNEEFILQSSDGPVTMKPNTFFGYSYDASSGIAQVTTNAWQIGLGITNVQTRIVTDPLELMPFVARPRSLAVGAQGGVGGSINGGEFNLETQLHFTDAPFDHSGQFHRNIQTPQVQGFYTNLLIKMFPAL